MNRMNARAAVCAVGISCFAAAGVSGAGKSQPTMALYQHFDQSVGRFSVVDQVKLHPDGSYDQIKQTSERPKSDEPDEPRKTSKMDDDDMSHGNPPKDAGVAAWKNPHDYWRAYGRNSDLFPAAHGRKSDAFPAAHNDTDTSPKKCSGTWRFLSKSGGAISPMPKSVMDVPEGSVIELDRAMPLGPVSKVWTKIDLMIPAKEFDYYHYAK